MAALVMNLNMTFEQKLEWCVTYIVNDQRNHQQKLFYIFMVVHGSKIH